MAVTLTNSFEGITPSGTTLTAGAGGNTGGTSGSFFDILTIGATATLASDSAHAAHGGLGVKVATGGTAATSNFSWSASLTGTSVTTAWFRQYLYFTANPAAILRVLGGLSSAATLCASFVVDTAGKVRALNAAGTTILTSAASIPLNAWFRVEGFITGSATVGQLEFKLFTTAIDGVTADETQTSSAVQNTNTTLGRLTYGISGSAVANAGPYWADDLGASDTAYLGPSVVPQVPGVAMAPMTGA